MAVQHGQQHGQAVTVQAHAQAPGRGTTGIDQGLDFDQHGARAFQRDQHTAAGHGLGVLAQENGARVAHAFEAFFGHGEDANFVDRAKTVFDGPHQSVGGVGVALEIQHGVHHVLEHTWPGQGAFFGDVAHQYHRRAGGLGHAGEVGRAFAHLRHRTRRAGELVGIHGLDRVHHHHRRFEFVDRGQHFFQQGFSQHLHLAVVQAQTSRAQRHLGRRLFARHIQGGHAAALQTVHGLQQQGGLANAGVSANQHHAAVDHAATEHPVELFLAGGGARHVVGFDVRQHCHFGTGCECGHAGVAVFAGAG